MVNWKQMIELNDIFFDGDKRLALWCDEKGDTNDLAGVANNIIENGLGLISVLPDIVPVMWTYLEKNKVKIFARYDFRNVHKDMDADMSVLSENITKICKNGANGIQLFIKMRDFERVLDSLQTVRDDLFFGHDLCVVMDISDADVNNWDFIFQKLRDIRADAVGLFFGEDVGMRSDFIGRIYGMLQNWNFDGDVHFMFNNNVDRIDQTIRLIESMRPELMDKTHFFLEY